MSASWYDVLGVDEHASAAEIRTAWKDSIADLSPGDRKFRVCNEAAEVLLDPERRAAYDAELGIAGGEVDETPDEADGQVDEPIDAEAAGSTSPTPSRRPAGAEAGRRRARCRRCPGWLIIGLAVARCWWSRGWRLLAPAVRRRRPAGRDRRRRGDRRGPHHRAAGAQLRLQEPRGRPGPGAQVLTGDLKTDYADLWQKALITNVKKAKAFATSEVVNAGVACVSDDGRRSASSRGGRHHRQRQAVRRPDHLVHRHHGGRRRQVAGADLDG